MNIPSQMLYRFLEILLLTITLVIIILLGRRLSKQGIDITSLLEVLTDINFNKVLYGSSAPAVIRCKKNDEILYELKREFIRGKLKRAKNLDVRNREFLVGKLTKAVYGKERLSSATIHAAFTEVKLHMINRMERVELYVVIISAMFIFLPLLTLLALALIGNRIILTIIIVGITLTFEILYRWLSRWIKI